MDHDRRGRLFGLELEGFRQADADVLLRIEQGEQLSLVFEVRTRRIAERIPRPAVLLVEEVTDARGIFAGDAEVFAHGLVMKLGEGTIHRKIGIDLPRPRDTRAPAFLDYVDTIESYLSPETEAAIRREQ